ncbi:MAG: hypothetical protein IJX85_05550 [Lachnospiraceae bacterium]|nr:hypothetical protein [Lachnospiraceae bacterium]
MKRGTKIVLLISLILMIVAAVVVLVLVIAGEKKDFMTAREFYEEMEDEGYELVDVTSQYYSYGIDEAYVAVASNDRYQIEFYELNSISKAENMFETNKDYFEGRAGSSRITSSYGLGDYDVYSLTSNGDYMYLCRIDNTLLYIDVDDRYKEEVKEIIDELDY